MHTLGREIRFSIDPFARRQEDGFNSYTSKPHGTDGLGLYISMQVELSSALNPDTGFVVNVSEIDKVFRKTAVPLVIDTIQACYRQGHIPTLEILGRLLRECRGAIAREFPDKKVEQLILNMNPYRSVGIRSEDPMNLYYSEKFEFSAMHQLWNDQFSESENLTMFGKCANPAGHGHNYILEVKVLREEDIGCPHWITDYQKTVQESFLELVDHKNLNVDVPDFREMNPTVENLSRFAWEKLVGALKNCKLCSITIWENDRTYCSYSE